MSIAENCPVCCTCPTARYDITSPVISISTSCTSKSSSDAYLCGFSGYDDGSYDGGDPSAWAGAGKKWTVKTLSGGSVTVNYSGIDCTGVCTGAERYEYSGAVSFSGCTKTSAGVREDYNGCPNGTTLNSTNAVQSVQIFYGCQDPFIDHSTLTVKTTTPCPSCFNDIKSQTRYDATETLSVPDTIEAAIARTEFWTGSGCCAVTGTIDPESPTTPESEESIYLGGLTTSVVVSLSILGDPDTTYSIKVTYSNETDGVPQDDSFDSISATTDGDGLFEADFDVPQPDAGSSRCFIRAELDAGAEYEVSFRVPKIGPGKCLRAAWNTRIIGEGGVGVSSVSVNFAGSYRPKVTIAPPPTGGTQAYAIADMSSTGTITGIRVLNPGSGYASSPAAPPVISVDAAINGGTSSTGWTATVVLGAVTGITGGSSGNYLPTLTFLYGGGLGATATCTMNSSGGIATVAMGASGSGYTTEPSLSITPKSAGIAYAARADLLIHLGTETQQCSVWDGVIPEGYDPEAAETWPRFGPFEFSDSLEVVRNLRTFCDCSTCP